MKGIVKYLNPRGYGFIVLDEKVVENPGGDIFFHGRDLREVEFHQLKIGQHMVIDHIDETSRGTTAREVRLA